MAHALKGLLLLALAGPLLAQLPPASPEAEGMSQARLDRVSELIRAEVASGRLGAASIIVARHGHVVLHQGFGRLSRAPDSPSVQPDSVYFVASPTKALTACAVMLLVERGQVALSDPAQHYIPEFTGGGREDIRLRDLLRHTSGLPDMLPENIDLRRAHAPLSEFVRRTITTPLLFPPGSQFRYQSMGILLAGDIVERVTKTRLPEFEQKEIFQPLDMKNSALGMGKFDLADTVIVDPEPGWPAADEANFGQNSLYWREMGQPWCGMHSTTTDYAILLETFLNGGVYAGKQVFSKATVEAMTTNQNTELHAPWGLGWSLGRAVANNEFGDLISEKTFGHSGGNGTVAWADPQTQVVCVILTNRHLGVDGGRFLRLVSNAVAASVESRR
jgi:CubicO group peptidase (beta-lactamase class C family)